MKNCNLLGTSQALVIAVTWSMVVLFSPTAVCAQGADTVVPVEKTLPSGARAVLLPRPGSGTVLVTVAIPAGSQDESPAVAGLSHYLEHLLFDGFDELDERGVTEAFERRSAYINAFTREQTTVFFALTPRDEAVASAELLRGMLSRSKIVQATFEKERKVILEELAKDHASPDGKKEEALRAALWQGTPLAHPVGGSQATVAATTRDEVVAYWKRRYQPGGWRILVTGDLPVDGLAEVLAVFADLEAGERLQPRSDPLTWPGWGRWQATPMPESKGAPAMGGMPGMGMGHGMGGGGSDAGTLALVIAVPDQLSGQSAAVELVARWLGDASGPLQTALVPGLATGVSVSRLPRQPRDMLELRFDASDGVVPEELLARALGVLTSAAKGPDDGAVLRLANAWSTERALTGQRLHYAAVLYGEDLAAARSSLTAAIEPPAVDAEQVRKTAQVLLSSYADSCRAVWVGEGGPVQATVLPEPLEPETEQLLTVLVAGPMNGWVATLGNGLQVGLLAESGSPVFGIHLLVADRTLNEPAGAAGIADLAHRLLPGGTTVSGSRELARRLARAGVDLKEADSPMIPFDDRYHVPDFSYVRLEGPAENLEVALTGLAEMIRDPAWDAAGWETAVAGHEAARKADNRGSALASQAMRRALLGADHPLTLPVSGRVGAPLPDEGQVRRFWGRWPAGYFAPQGLVLTVASPLPVDQTLEMIEDLFAGGPGAVPRRGPYPAPVAAADDPNEVGAGAEQITVMLGRSVCTDQLDREALLVAVNALSDRMVAEIREREGLAYRLGAGVRALPDGHWLISASVGTRPENRERVVELLHELCGQLATELVVPSELERLAARSRRSTMLRSLSAASRAYRLGRVLFEGPGSPLLVDNEARARVTPERLRDVAAEVLDPQQLALVISD